MARKKAPEEKKRSNPIGFRISPRAAQALEALTTEFGLNRTAAIEVALIHLVETARRPTSKRAIALINAEKKSQE